MSADAGGLVVEAWETRGASFPVKVHAGAKRDRIAGLHDGMLKVEVTTAPEKGKANKAVAKLLAKALGVAPGELTLLSGETNTRKRFGVAGVSAEELRGKLTTALTA